MSQTITPFLMFDGCAEQAVRFYVAIFEDAEIRRIEREPVIRDQAGR